MALFTNRADRLNGLLDEMDDSKQPEHVALASAIRTAINTSKPSEAYPLALTTAIELAACARELVQNLKAIGALS